MARSRMIDAALCALACALTGSCVDDSVSVRIDCVVPPSAECTYSPTGDVCNLGGTLNVAADSSYRLGLRVVNGLRARARTSPPLAEPNGFNVEGVDVRILAPSGASYDFEALPNPFFVPATGWAAPGGGKTVAGAIAVPKDYIAVLARNESNSRKKVGSLLLELSVRATTDGSVSVDSDAITFPVELVEKSIDYSDGQCGVAEGTVCLLGQDENAFACDPRTVPE
jgi:hypothetical protein